MVAGYCEMPKGLKSEVRVVEMVFDVGDSGAQRLRAYEPVRSSLELANILR